MGEMSCNEWFWDNISCIIKRLHPCPQCDEYGQIECRECEGKRQFPCPGCAKCGKNPKIKTPVCKNGYVDCHNCEGKGRVTCQQCMGAAYYEMFSMEGKEAKTIEALYQMFRPKIRAKK